MKTYKTFRNINQVINEVQGIAFDVARAADSYLPISDSKIDAELLRNSTADQRAAGITIYVREHGTQFVHAEDVAEVRAAWGPQIVRTIEISKQRGDLWVVALDCATRYDNNGEPIARTAAQLEIDAKEAESVASMARTEAYYTPSDRTIKAAELAQVEATRVRNEALRAAFAAEAVEPANEDENSDNNPNEDDDDNESGNTMNAADVELFAAQSSAYNATASACKVLAVRARQMLAKVAHTAKAATRKAVALAAVALGLALSLVAFFGAGLAFGELLDTVAAFGVVFPGAWRGVVCVVFLFTVALDLACWVSLQYMSIADKCHALAIFGGIYYRIERNGVFVRPFSVIGRLAHAMRTA